MEFLRPIDGTTMGKIAYFKVKISQIVFWPGNWPFALNYALFI